MKRQIVLTILTALVLTGCSSASNSNEPTPTPTATASFNKYKGKNLEISIIDKTPFSNSKNNGDGTCSLLENVDIGVYKQEDTNRNNVIAFGSAPAGTLGELRDNFCAYSPILTLPAKTWNYGDSWFVDYITPSKTSMKVMHADRTVRLVISANGLR
ncbi:hypothetical protein DDD64_05180 [Actinotignum sanguinis]|uniref:hypothetical protein n=1 Tax=Actinotignum sanguinis TaxID=1445614 RepID=UPI000F7D6469|nr:hypothetical protein [Actinotignum sanguinis]MDK7198354.1 hypothetical protein [Actinotignum sanguinis]MDY5147533.1 hypothetical protein [Actinotignum sanguinis]RTE49410.1 hypothetical protein DDD64_05180 [Actinotignum sanguinis]